MAAQRHAHVVHLDGDGVGAEQPLVQQLDLRALDKSQFEQSAFQIDGLGLMVTMVADFDDDAAIAEARLAQPDGPGHECSLWRAGAAASLRFGVSDYQVRQQQVQCRFRAQGRRRTFRPTCPHGGLLYHGPA